jgi:Na+/melibiose symporter-like transporter
MGGWAGDAGRRLDVPRFDLVGYGLLVLLMVCLSLGLDRLAAPVLHAQAVWQGVGLLWVGLLGLLGYVWHSRRAVQPLFSLSLFANTHFRAGILGNFFARMGGSSLPFILPLYFQVGLGYRPVQAGLMLAFLTVGSIVVKGVLPALVRRYGYAVVLRSNTLLVGMGLISLLALPAEPFWLLSLHLVLLGAFNSIQFVATNALTLKDLKPDQAASGNSLMSMTMMLSMSVGVALVSVLLNGVAQVEQAFHTTFVMMGLLTLLASVIFWRLPADPHTRE